MSENKEMKAVILRESDRIAATMQSFKKAEDEFAKAKDEYKSLQDSFIKCQKALHGCQIILKYPVSCHVIDPLSPRL